MKNVLKKYMLRCLNIKTSCQNIFQIITYLFPRNKIGGAQLITKHRIYVLQ